MRLGSYLKRCEADLQRCEEYLQKFKEDLKRYEEDLKRCAANLQRCAAYFQKCAFNINRVTAGFHESAGARAILSAQQESKPQVMALRSGNRPSTAGTG